VLVFGLKIKPDEIRECRPNRRAKRRSLSSEPLDEDEGWLLDSRTGSTSLIEILSSRVRSCDEFMDG